MELLKTLIHVLIASILIFLFCYFEPGQVSIGPSRVVAQVIQSTPVRVYMIHNTTDNKWYSNNPLGMVIWVDQNKAVVWTIKGDIERVYSGLSKKRKADCQIKVFVLLPVAARTTSKRK